jgi:hypothetical protein
MGVPIGLWENSPIGGTRARQYVPCELVFISWTIPRMRENPMFYVDMLFFSLHIPRIRSGYWGSVDDEDEGSLKRRTIKRGC